MDGTRTYASRRCVNRDPAPELAQAVQISRFWRMVERRGDDECWPWQGDVDKNGYGIFVYEGVRRPAHELALSFTTGEVRADGLDTCHTCDNPPCCNPACLRFGTRQDNVDDMISRGRARRAAKLTEEIVRTIRQRKANGALGRDLAADYGVSEAYISNVINGIAWPNAGGPITGRSKRTPKRKAA